MKKIGGSIFGLVDAKLVKNFKKQKINMHI